MLESVINYLNVLDPSWIYIILFLFSFIENVFPPSPSDVVVVVGATMIGASGLGFIPILLITSVGSALGFILMYYVGKMFGEKIIRTGKLSFVSEEELKKPDEWFKKYGYKLILVNRFLPGTRSVISFFSGLHELDLGKTFLNASISAFLWNAIIIYLGMTLGSNVERIDYYLSTYSNIIFILTGVAVLFVVIYFLVKRRGQKK